MWAYHDTYAHLDADNCICTNSVMLPSTSAPSLSQTPNCVSKNISQQKFITSQISVQLNIPCGKSKPQRPMCAEFRVWRYKLQVYSFGESNLWPMVLTQMCSGKNNHLDGGSWLDL